MKVKNLRSKNTKMKLKKKNSKKPVWELTIVTIVFPMILEMILETLPLLRFLKGVPGLR